MELSDLDKAFIALDIWDFVAGVLCGASMLFLAYQATVVIWITLIWERGFS